MNELRTKLIEIGNLVVLFLFYNFYVYFNLNYIVVTH